MHRPRLTSWVALLILVAVLTAFPLAARGATEARPPASATSPQAVQAGGSAIACPGIKTITIDGANDFSAASYITESPFAAPTAGGSATQSDLYFETATYHWIDGSWVDHSLTGGNTADVRDFWVSWDQDYLYLGVKGPNAMMDTDLADLFIAIDRDGSQSGSLGQASTAWGKWLDFSGWSPSHFIAVSQARDVSDGSPAGYAELVTVGGSSSTLTWGSAWSNSGWASDTNGGVFFEFRLGWAQLGLSGPPNWDAGGAAMNFALYTTYNDGGYDGYDSAPGAGNGSTYEQIGDYKGDADHCAGTSGPDPVTGTTTETTCNYGDSDKTNGPGNSQAGRSPGSDDGAGETPDTIGEYFRITNVGALSRIGDLVYADLNANGVYQTVPDQPMGAGVTVNLTGAASAATTTLAGGLYTFDKLTCGSYSVSVNTSTLPDPSSFGSYVGPWVAQQNAGGFSVDFTTGAPGQNLGGDFGFAPQNPTAITLGSFTATGQADAVLVAWETLSEIGNAGFHLYRDTAPAGPGARLNASLIPSQGAGSPAGFSYTYLDSAGLAAGTTYYYWLEDVSLGGVATRHAPASVTFGAPTAVTLGELGAGSASSLLMVVPVLAGLGLASFGLAGLAFVRRRPRRP